VHSIPTASVRFAPDANTRDIDAAVTAQAALVILLLHDQRTRGFLNTFEGLMDHARRLAAFYDDFARECGWRNRAHMFTDPWLHDETRSPRIEQFVAEGVNYPRSRLAGYRAAADHLIYTVWALPRDHPREQWSWLAVDLQLTPRFTTDSR
jgi:hypothetical protein